MVSAAHEPGRVGCRLWGVGAAFWCPKWPVPLSRLFGGGLESHRNPLKSVGTASGWCGVGHHHVPAKCARGYPRKRPGSTPNPKSGSEIVLDARSLQFAVKYLQFAVNYLQFAVNYQKIRELQKIRDFFFG